MRIIDVPIEPIPMRYSKQWGRWFPEAYQYLGVDHLTINPVTITEGIEKGRFLDVCGTHYAKASQLKLLSEMIHTNEIHDEEVIFFHDLWFPGIEMLFYMRDALGIPFKIAGILHAGTWDPHDMLHQMKMQRWAYYWEAMLLKEVDAVFVATKFHKNLICEYLHKIIHDFSYKTNKYFGDFSDKIHVTGLPIYPEFVTNTWSNNTIVFPHRWDDEKQPQLWERLVERMKNRDIILKEKYKFVATNTCKSKEEYYQVLNSSKIALSFALQETWGIAMQEAVLCGCMPFVPDRLSYKEMYPSCFRYSEDDIEVIANGIESLITNWNDFQPSLGDLRTKITLDGSMAINRMVSIMYGLE